MPKTQTSLYRFFEDNSRFFLWVVLILSAYGRLWYVLYYLPYESFLDGEAAFVYHKAVMSFYRGDFAPEQWSTVSPLGHMLLSWIFKIAYFLDLYPHKLAAVLVTNILLSTLSIYWVYRIALRLWDRGGYALLSATVYGVFFPLVYRDAFVLVDHPAECALILGIWMVLEYRGWLHLWLAGGVLAAAAAIDPVQLPVGIVVFGYLVARERLARSGWGRGAIFLLGFGTVLLGVSVQLHTLSAGKLKGFSAAASLDYYLHACRHHAVRSLAPETNATYVTRATDRPAAYGEAVVSVPLSAQGYFVREATRCLRDAPPDPLLVLRDLGRIWTSDPYHGMDTSSARAALDLSWRIFGWMAVALLLAPLLGYAPSIHRLGVVLLTGVVLAEMAAMLFVGGVPRFGLRMFFVSDVLGILLLTRLPAILRRRWWQSLLYLILIGGLLYGYHALDLGSMSDTTSFVLGE